MVVVSSLEIPGIRDTLLVEILSKGRQNHRLLYNIDTRANLRYKKAVTLRYKVKGIRANIISMLYTVLKAIWNQEGGDNKGPANKKRYNSWINSSSNLILNEIA